MFESSPSHALTSSFGSIDPVLTNTIIQFSHLKQTEVPIQVLHWKNSQFEVCLYRNKMSFTS
jgi:hypothetical protein